MSSEEDNENEINPTPAIGTSVSKTTLPPEGTTDDRNSKKRKILDDQPPQTISEKNITRFKVLKKLNIQLTRTNHHINYLNRILHLILTKTAFRFYDYMYEQISGTTIGTICAPSMAIIFMGKIEEEFLATRTLLPLVWWRYIDDIFMVWPHSPTELYSFLSALNNVHETIKFTSNASQESVSFLDVMIHKDNKGQIETGLYTKPTDAHMYLHY